MRALDEVKKVVSKSILTLNFFLFIFHLNKSLVFYFASLGGP